ncbi:tetratricopeptide repeat protein [Actinocorallia sp. API 0066]|uniref:tetratricopeptide repeat protein n=1 Tax=Actinocorallia sp. API 0066 TaxID=2896846 RepID=UPI001E301C04|nr:tetratricopeptide repeat protein [Actinocorallia sp. API 0066]MCD0447625.1 tetratricopeptide repeat protein [Actinocorallia sp. API 0066]
MRTFPNIAGFTGATTGAPADRWERATAFFTAKDYRSAIELLTPLAEEFPGQVATRLLLARAYFHSAQLRRAEAELRAVLDLDPTEAYAHLMLGRTLQRQSRDAEAVPHLRMADLWGL